MTTNTVPGISALQCVISSLRDTAHLSDEGGELTDQLRELRDWALSTAAQPAVQQGEPLAWMDDGTLRVGSEATAYRVVTDATKRGMTASLAANFITPLYAHPAAPTAQPPAAPQEELREDASYESMNLAAMVLSDCGHSSNYTPLLERVAGRIDRHVERLLTAQRADLTMRAQAAPAAVASPLTKLQRKAIDVCFTSDKVSVSEVQRKLSISYADAQTLCQSIVDLGLTDELELAPSLKQRGAPAPQAAPVAHGDAEDAARYRFLAGHCRSTSEHWGGRWSIIVDGPAPKSHDSEDDFDAAIDAARSQAKEGA